MSREWCNGVAVETEALGHREHELAVRDRRADVVGEFFDYTRFGTISGFYVLDPNDESRNMTTDSH